MVQVLSLLAVAAFAAVAFAASPPSGKIVFSSASGATGKTQVWMMNANGSGRHAVTPATSFAEQPAIGGGVAWAPAWSPDGKRLAYEFNGGTSPVNPTNEIWVMNADGSHATRLTHNALEDIQPVWSPDGAWLAFASERPHSGRNHIWLMRPNGKGLHRASKAAGEE